VVNVSLTKIYWGSSLKRGMQKSDYVANKAYLYYALYSSSSDPSALRIQDKYCTLLQIFGQE
jgi:hypothetical protein